MAKSVRRPQAQKSRAQVRQTQQIRQSNAAGPHRRVTDYRRRPKHVGMLIEDWDFLK